MTRTPFEPGDGTPEPDERRAAEGPAAGSRAAGRPDAGRPSGGQPPGPLDELALRRLLHDAVRDVAPRRTALDDLARAVPARRARRRQAMVGTAAGVLLIGTAVPAVLHLAGSGAGGAARAERGPARGSSSGTPGGELPGDPFDHPRLGTDGAGVSPRASVPVSGATGPVGDPADTPRCRRGQLGRGSASTGSPDAEGRVRGVFRVVNVSGRSCAVVGAGQIAVSARGDTSPGGIQVVDHTEGDPATALLPNPTEDPAAVVLPPGQAYQVQFAWIPASGGGSTGCAPGASGSGGSSGTTGSTGGQGGTGSGSTGGSSGTAGSVGGGQDAGDSGATAGSGDGGSDASDAPDALTATSTVDDGGTPGAAAAVTPSPTPANGGIALSTVPPEGGPAAATTDISGACAGTVYQTAPLPTA